jgi:YbbR domain-containing protein
MLRRNLRYKLLALALSIIIWSSANEGQNPNITRELKVPLDTRDVQVDYVVSNAPKMIKVSLEGQKSHVESLIAEPDTVSAYVKLRGQAAGQCVLPVKVEIPIGLKGLVHATASPHEVTINLDQKAQRTLPVDVQFVSPPPVGYRFGAPDVAPGKATVSGTAKQVNAVAQLVAEVESRGGYASGVDDELQLVAEDKDGNVMRGLEISPARVHVHLELLEAPASRIVFVSPDITGQPAFPYKVNSIEVSPQTISITGTADQLGSVTTLRTDAISVSGRTSDFTQRVRVLAPRGLAIGANRYVRVTVSIISTEPKLPAVPEKGN